MSLNCKFCEEINKDKWPPADWCLCPDCDKEIIEWLEAFPPLQPKYLDETREIYDY